MVPLPEGDRLAWNRFFLMNSVIVAFMSLCSGRLAIGMSGVFEEVVGDLDW